MHPMLQPLQLPCWHTQLQSVRPVKACLDQQLGGRSDLKKQHKQHAPSPAHTTSVIRPSASLLLRRNLHTPHLTGT